ncbi:MAG: YceI family protein [Qipengyuania sp.]|nr:YceI family protein [Qipengyuania sp.]
MNRLALAAAPALLLATLGGYAVIARPAMEPGKADPAPVTAGRYIVDGAHTLVGWRVDHLGISDYFGIFGDVAGTLDLDPRDLAATRLDVTIPVSKVTVASAGLRDHLLRPGKDGANPDFFGTKPADARFVSTAVKRTGATKASIAGNLTLNGVTRPVTIAAEFTGAGPHPTNKRLNIGFRGTAAIKRSDFGIAYGIPMVSDRVELDLTAAFEKPAAASDPPVATGDGCGSAAAEDFIGRKDTPALRAEARRKIGHGRIRWLPPGTIVTQDFRPDRLNVDIDAGGIVVRARCG